MRRFLKTALLSALLAAALTIPVHAAGFTHCADALKDLGLFRGTDKGYELDRAPTRLEAGAMLVRLLGQEEAASKLTYTAPFTDVPLWAQPYVQYLYENRLTNGTGEKTYGTGPCTARQYATFLLRALGYTDRPGGDFTYEDALAFAREKGVVDEMNCDEADFLRDHVAAMSYTALSCAPKTGETDLLTRLAEEGAVADAKGYDLRFAAFRAFSQATGAINGAKAFSMSFDVELTVETPDLRQGPSAISGTIDAELDRKAPDRSRFAVSAVEGKEKSSISYTNGTLYLDREGERWQEKLSLAPFLNGMGDALPVCACRDVRESDGAFRLVLAAQDLNGMACEKLELELTVEKGALKSVRSDMVLRMSPERKVTAAARFTGIRTEGVSVKLPDDLKTYPQGFGQS